LEVQPVKVARAQLRLCAADPVKRGISDSPSSPPPLSNPAISASVFINDDEPGLHRDFEAWLEKLAPEKPHSQYEHNGCEDNADAHLKRTVMGREVVVAVTGGKLDFGPWERIFYGEFDGKRKKRVLVKIIGQ
jgi:secondary thiamine-phosphate synthase enzyme